MNYVDYVRMNFGALKSSFESIYGINPKYIPVVWHIFVKSQYKRGLGDNRRN